MLGAVVGALVSGCVSVEPFQCESDNQCVLDGVRGSCQVTADTRLRACAFPDASCDGFRWDVSAATESAGECLPKGDGPIAEEESNFLDGIGNGCGGEKVLNHEPTEKCGPCNRGEYVCDGANAVVCQHNQVAVELLEEDFERVHAERCAKGGNERALIDGRLSTVCWTSKPELDSTPTHSDFDFVFQDRECVIEVQVFGNAGFARGREDEFQAEELKEMRANRGFASVTVQALSSARKPIASIAGLEFPRGIEPLRVHLPANDEPKQMSGGVLTKRMRLRSGPYVSDAGGGLSEFRVIVARPVE